MDSVCISKCVNDVHVPVRATYWNLYHWPDSDAEFVRTVSAKSNLISSRSNKIEEHGGYPRVVDSLACRQLYLKSYTFSRKETVPEKTVKCLGGVKQRMSEAHKNQKTKKKKKKCLVLRKVKEMSSAAILIIFRRLRSCSTRVDVTDLPEY
ncbi:hypothetical protein NE237_009224 [Protea cynaroides]|uniref:Uncharacterized protein n=1 Tax=Protea cynaroides TaxID=273540 RepID=A0A9Q0KY53_9MAGN|nr:hypothetical protein NE237_009224 [Protea cynaroides]